MCLGIFGLTLRLPRFTPMLRFLFVAGLATASLPVAAQQNPFKVQKSGVQNAQITYTMPGA